MSLDEKDKCAFEIDNNRLLTLECLNSTVISNYIHFV